MYSIRPGFLLSLAVHGGVAMAALGWWKSEQVTVARPHPSLLLTFDVFETAPAARDPVPPSSSARSKTPGPEPVTQTTSGSPPPPPLIQPPPALPVAQAVATTLVPARDMAGMRQAYAVRVWQHVARFRPRGVRLRGTATVAIEIADDGGLVSASLAQPSGSGRLDRLAVDAAMRATPYPPPPAGLGPADRSFLVPFAFQ